VDDVIVTGYVTRPWGANYTAWSLGHPLSPYYKSKPADLEFLPLHLQSSRIGYRQWLGLTFQSDNKLRVPARTIVEFQTRSQLFDGEHAYVRQRARMLVAGYAMDNMKPLDFGEALMPLVLASSAEANAEIARQAEHLIKAAEAVAGQLLNSVKLALFGEKSKADRDSAVLDPVRSRFWADTEQQFYDVLRDAAASFDTHKDELQAQAPAIQKLHGAIWLSHLKRHALQIFDDTVPIDSADGYRIEDLINARKFLLLALTGYGKAGSDIFKELNQPPPTKKSEPKKGRKAA
jgi:CRISPR system Cascade subunit CasA